MDPERFDRITKTLSHEADRRRVLRRAAAGIFGLAAAWTAQGIGPRGARASHCPAVSGDTVCHFPNGRRCKKCDGAICRSPCRPHLSFYAGSGGCYCTQPSMVDGVTGHYLCCDCSCGNLSSTRDCGCSQWVVDA
jgi:hypothetical protein